MVTMLQRSLATVYTEGPKLSSALDSYIQDSSDSNKQYLCSQEYQMVDRAWNALATEATLTQELSIPRISYNSFAKYWKSGNTATSKTYFDQFLSQMNSSKPELDRLAGNTQFGPPRGPQTTQFNAQDTAFLNTIASYSRDLLEYYNDGAPPPEDVTDIKDTVRNIDETISKTFSNAATRLIAIPRAKWRDFMQRYANGTGSPPACFQLLEQFSTAVQSLQAQIKQE